MTQSAFSPGISITLKLYLVHVESWVFLWWIVQKKKFHYETATYIHQRVSSVIDHKSFFYIQDSNVFIQLQQKYRATIYRRQNIKLFHTNKKVREGEMVVRFKGWSKPSLYTLWAATASHCFRLLLKAPCFVGFKASFYNDVSQCKSKKRSSSSVRSINALLQSFMPQKPELSHHQTTGSFCFVAYWTDCPWILVFRQEDGSMTVTLEKAELLVVLMEPWHMKVSIQARLHGPKEGDAPTKMGQVRHDHVFVFLLKTVPNTMDLGNESMTVRQQV